ncbi:rCG40088 [Rattus norvegicus]|uniref:RCG40088 n=1 Tax=Rattus norvegicus TaxID=10116 RepID=A6I818_RAT|nr:rCG40088 [Rattus norvegicus]
MWFVTNVNAMVAIKELQHAGPTTEPVESKFGFSERMGNGSRNSVCVHEVPGPWRILIPLQDRCKGCSSKKTGRRF